MNDQDLMAFICLAEQEVLSSTQGYPALALFVKRWKDGLATYGPGTIDLQIDDLVVANGALAELDTMLTALKARMEQFGATIPAAVLNDRCTAPGVRFLDYSTSFVTKICDRLTKLVHP